MFLNSYVVEQDGVYTTDNTITVSDLSNLFLVDGTDTEIQGSATKINELSQAKEKLLLSLHNYSKTGNKLPLNYPLTLELEQDGEIVFQESNISLQNLSQPYGFLIAKSSGRYDLKVTDASGFVAYRTFDVLPDIATNMDVVLSTTLQETGGNIATHIVTVQDKFGNPATGSMYTLDMNLNGK